MEAFRNFALLFSGSRDVKWLSPPTGNPPLENLKTFLQKRIRAIMAKEWWDFIVNVNTLNSDHASLLYSLANLCPSFNYFLQSKDKELQLIIKKRPVVKPRIFSGSERIDTTPEPIVPKQLPLVTRRNSANELVKILNELYPNENTLKNKQPRTYGPASKQKKIQSGPNKKNVSMNTGDFMKKINSANSFGRSPLLKSLLADESQKENSHTATIKNIVPPQLSMPVLQEDNNEFNKAILSNKNYDLNQNRLNQNPRKIKKIIKIKKRRYVYSNALTDPKSRLKYILEDESPNLSLKLIKKYRIKKCSVDISRLKDSVLKYYDELRVKITEQNVCSLEKKVISVTNDEMLSCTSQISEQEKSLNTNCCPQSAEGSTIEQGGENHEKVISQTYHKDNVTVVERLNPKELKNMYCHGGIVPLGKVITTDKVVELKNRHLFQLKDKKSNDAAENILKLKEINKKRDESVMETSGIDCKQLVSEVALITEPNAEEPRTVIEASNHSTTNEKADLDKRLSDVEEKSISYDISYSIISQKDSIQQEDSKNSEAYEINKIDLMESKSDDISERTCDVPKSVENFEGNALISTEKIEVARPTCTNEILVVSSETIIDNEEVIEPIVGDKVEPEGCCRSLDSNYISNLVCHSSPQKPEESPVLETKQDIDSNDAFLNAKELEPLSKRPRIEINLTEMKLEITKTIVDSGNNADHICKMCKLSFDSVESWNGHIQKNIPKCTPNLEVSWDSTEISL